MLSHLPKGALSSGHAQVVVCERNIASTTPFSRHHFRNVGVQCPDQSENNRLLLSGKCRSPKPEQQQSEIRRRLHLLSR